MTKVKICGVNSAAAFDAVAAAGTDYVGFVFFERSPRFVTPNQAAALTARHTGGPLRAGLFVEPNLPEIAAALTVVDLDILQIYGSADLCRQIRAEFGVKVWRGIGVATASDLPEGDEGLDGFVIEAKAPRGATRPGGNGVTMPWSLLPAWKGPPLWLLAGGLDAGNVAQAIALTGAPGVDTSSGVEARPGEKSPALIHDLVAEVRRAGAKKQAPA